MCIAVTTEQFSFLRSSELEQKRWRRRDWRWQTVPDFRGGNGKGPIRRSPIVLCFDRGTCIWPLTQNAADCASWCQQLAVDNQQFSDYCGAVPCRQRYAIASTESRDSIRSETRSQNSSRRSWEDESSGGRWEQNTIFHTINAFTH